MKHFANFQYPYADTWDKNRVHIKFTLANVHYSLANSIRRAMISKVSTVGFRSEPHKISTIKVDRNDTYLNNQIISHRIAMLPIHIVRPDKFDTEDYQFELDVSNDTNAIRLITSADIRVKRISSNTYLSDKETKELFPADSISGAYSPIVKLVPKYHTNIGGHDLATDTALNMSVKIPVSEPMCLKLSAKSIVSIGSENGHYSPVSVCSYGNTIDQTQVPEKEQAYIDALNAQTAKYGLTPIAQEKLKKRFHINEVQRVFITDEYGDPSSFDFTVESVGVIPPLIIMERALEWCIAEVMQLVVNLESGNEKLVHIKPVPQLSNGFEITVENADDTLGNMLQCWLTRTLADYSMDPADRKLEAITYHRTHPLETRVVFMVKPIDSADYMTTVQTVFKPGCEAFIKHLEAILTELRGTVAYINEAKAIAAQKY
jgi:DNA-directed RNA polymerase subunit L